MQGGEYQATAIQLEGCKSMLVNFLSAGYLAPRAANCQEQEREQTKPSSVKGLYEVLHHIISSFNLT